MPQVAARASAVSQAQVAERLAADARAAAAAVKGGTHAARVLRETAVADAESHANKLAQSARHMQAKPPIGASFRQAASTDGLVGVCSDGLFEVHGVGVAALRQELLDDMFNAPKVLDLFGKNTKVGGGSSGGSGGAQRRGSLSLKIASDHAHLPVPLHRQRARAADSERLVAAALAASAGMFVRGELSARTFQRLKQHKLLRARPQAHVQVERVVLQALPTLADLLARALVESCVAAAAWGRPERAAMGALGTLQSSGDENKMEEGNTSPAGPVPSQASAINQPLSTTTTTKTLKKAARVPGQGLASASALSNQDFLLDEIGGVQPVSEESQPGSQGAGDDDGNELEPDFTEDATLQWYAEAAGRGDAGAAFALGCMHDDGARGCPQDHGKAAKWCV